MYEHLVLFKFNEIIPEERQQQFLNQLLSFKGKIPGIHELTAGINQTEEVENKHGYTLALRVTFKNKKALDDYLPHPVHQKFVSSLGDVIEKVIVADYEI